MRPLFPLAAAAVLTLSVPAFAQEPAAPAAPATAEAPQSPEEAAMEAKAEAFEARLQQMEGQLETIMGDESKDAATKTAEVDAVLNTYSPEITVFGNEIETFIRAEAEKPENAENKDQIATQAGVAGQAIRSIPDQVRAGVQQALAAQAAAPAAPVAPAEPQ